MWVICVMPTWRKHNCNLLLFVCKSLCGVAFINCVDTLSPSGASQAWTQHVVLSCTFEDTDRTLYLTAAASSSDGLLARYLFISVVTEHHDSYLICTSVSCRCHNGSLGCIFPQHHQSQMSVHEGVNFNLETVPLMNLLLFFFLSDNDFATWFWHSYLYQINSKG